VTPAIFAESKLRDELLLLHDVHEKLKSRNNSIRAEFISIQIKAIAGRIDLILSQIDVVETAAIHLRLENLDYDLIAKLQKDRRVCPVTTPQTSASIKISLGTIRKLAEMTL